MKHILSEFECSGSCSTCPDIDCPFRDVPYGSQSPLIEKE